MESRDLLFRLLYRALIDIRMASMDGNVRATGEISNLVHNVPLAMINSDADDVLNKLAERAQVLGMSSWLQTALKDISQNDGAD